MNVHQWQYLSHKVMIFNDYMHIYVPVGNIEHQLKFQDNISDNSCCELIAMMLTF